jgi:hypothetical protein
VVNLVTAIFPLKSENWIPGVNLSFTATRFSLPENQTVSLLLDNDGLNWDDDIIRHFFCDEESNLILDIPISSDSCTDFISWPHSRTGVNTVRSAYNLAQSECLRSLLASLK